MGMTIFRPGARLVIPGVQVYQPRPSAAAANWWDVAGQTCIAAYAPKGAASLAASYINLANPGTYDAAPGVAPTWDATGGWTFNGSTQYLTTGIVPAAGWSMAARYSSSSAGGWGSRVAFGSNQFYILSHNRFAYGTAQNDGLLGVAAATVALAGSSAYVNGTFGATIAGTFSLPCLEIFLGAVNNGGAAGLFMNGKIQAIAFYSTTLSAGDVASRTTAMNAL